MPGLQIISPWQLVHEIENMIEVKEIILFFRLYIIILLIYTSLRLIGKNMRLKKSIEKETKKEIA